MIAVFCLRPGRDCLQSRCRSAIEAIEQNPGQVIHRPEHGPLWFQAGAETARDEALDQRGFELTRCTGTSHGAPGPLTLAAG